MPLASSDARISVEMTDPRKLTNFTSSTHRIGVQMSEARTLVTATPLNKRNKEFVFGYDIDEAAFTLSAVIHKDPGQPAYLAIAMGTDSTVASRTSKDVTIVLDHSGSMDGAPLHEARAAAKEIVSRLTTNDRLNILAFDDRVDSLFPRLEKVTEKSRTAALHYLDQIQSGGGTDIGFALERALGTQRVNAERPLVLLLTDGESDASRVFAVAEKDQSPVRIFTVGLGAGVNRPLLSRLSDMKRGKFTYIQSTEAIRSSVERLFDLVETSVFSAPELVLEQGTLIQMHPTTLPDLAPGEELFITARAQGIGPVKLVLKGKGIVGPISREILFDLGNQAIHPWVGRTWAENRVDRLLEDISLLGESPERKNEAIELAVSYGFVTPYTSFLAIPENELTATTSTMMADMRARKQSILAKRSDAVALSRSQMPPGDPVLTLEAPADALRVTAYFPFGLEKDLVTME